MKLISLGKLKEFFGGRQRVSEAVEINPGRDWKAILVFILVAGMTIIAFSAYLYWKINSGGFLATFVKDELPIETIDRGELKKVIEIYESKKTEFQILKNEKPVAIDPSF